MGLSSGSLVTVLREGPFAGIYFVIYKNMKYILNVLY
jgi:Fe2+ transport system protein FeoA